MALNVMLSVVGNMTADLIKRSLREVFGAQVERKVRKLQSILSTVQAVLEDAEKKQLTDESLINWLAKLKLVAYDADDLLEDFNVKIELRRMDSMMEKVIRFLSIDNPLLFRMKMARRIKDVVGRFDSLAEEKNKFHLTAVAGGVEVMPSISRPQTHSYMPESDAIGREEDVKKIINLLIGQENEKDVSVLPIVGMGGLGKTTLAQLVYNHQSMAQHFQHRIWVSVSDVSDNFDISKIVQSILESITDDAFLMRNLDPLQRRLRNVLDGKRYLLVLDDVWCEHQHMWNELRVLLKSGSEGNAIIVTTRSDKVASIVGTLTAYELTRLSDDANWDLFQRVALSRVAELSSNMIAIGKHIIEKCGGLPLAVVILGGLMQSKVEESEWRSVLENHIWDTTIGQVGILPALRLSYNHLRPHVKQCFALCAMFPKGYVMERDLLIQLWMGNDFIPSDSRMELELKAQEILQDLVSRSLLSRYYNQVVNAYVMHDLVHDLAQSIMGDECRVLSMGKDWYNNKDNVKELRNSTTRHISITHEDASCIDRSSYPKKMRTYLHLRIINALDFQFLLYPTTKYLRVLDLSKTCIIELPGSICKLRHLRYLDLSYTNIKTVPKSIGRQFNLQTLKLNDCGKLRALPEAICKLFNLQTLKLDRCGELGELPRGIGDMCNLRHLTLKDCVKIKRMPAGMGRLIRLKTLTFYLAGKDAGSGIGELKDMDLNGELMLGNLKSVKNVTEAREANLGSKENIHDLVLRWGEPPSSVNELEAGNAEAVLEALRPHQGLKTLKIEEYDGVNFPTWLMENSTFLMNLIEIKLYDCSRCEHLPQLSKLQFLMHLTIEKMPSIKHIGGTAFCSRGAADSGAIAFPSLRVFSLLCMDNLEKWSGVEGRQSFPLLDHLNVNKCQRLLSLPELPSVRHLYASGCPLLRPAKGFFRCMTSLETLRIVSCDKLVLMLEQEDEVGLASLRRLYIFNCHQQMFSSPSLGLWKNLGSLIVLSFSACDGLISLPIEVLQGLSSLRFMQIDGCCNLTGSTSSSSPSSSRAGGLHLQYLNVLTTLNVMGCNKLASFSPDGLRYLTTLHRLIIGNCEELVELPMLPESLQEVDISFCPNIISLPEGLGCLTALESLTLAGLPMLSSLPPGMQRLTMLDSLFITSCRLLVTLPVGLQQRISNLKRLHIRDCPYLERLFSVGDEYWQLVSSIPELIIGTAIQRIHPELLRFYERERHHDHQTGGLGYIMPT